MIKPRKRFLAVILVMAVALFWAYSYLHSPEFQNKIKKTVEDGLAEAIDADIQVEKISLGFFSVKVHGANISIPLNSVRVKIDDLTVGFSLRALLQKKWSPDELIDKIILVNPELVYEPLFDDQDEGDALLPSEIAEIVLRNMKIREVIVRNCTLRIVSRKGASLFSVDNLNGKAVKKEDFFHVSLKNRKRFRKSLFSIELHLSEDINKQQLSIHANKYNVKSYLDEDKKSVTATLDGSLEFAFEDKAYPSCLLPVGSFDIINLSYKSGKRAICYADSVRFTANDGVIRSDNITLELEKSLITGTLSTSIADDFLLLGVHYSDTVHGINAHAVLEHDSTMAANRFKHSFSAIKDSLILSGRGFYQNGEVSVEKGSLTLPGIVGALKGTLYTSGGYDGSYEGAFTRNIDSSTNVKGDFSFTYESDSFAIPEAKGLISAIVEYNRESVSLPDLDISLSPTGLLKLKGINRELALSAKVDNIFKDTLPPLEVSVSLKDRFLKRAEYRYNKSHYIKDGKLDLDLQITKDSIPIVLKGDIKTTEGDLSVNGTVTVDRDQNVSFSFPRVDLERDSVQFPCFISGNKKGSYLSCSIGSKKYSMKGNLILDLEQQECITSEISIQKCNLSLFNGLVPSLKELRKGRLSTNIKSRGKFDSLYVFGDIRLDSLQTDGVSALSCSTAFTFVDKQFALRPFYIEAAGDTLIKIDSMSYEKELYLDGQFHNLSLSSVIADKRVPKGTISGIVKSMGDEGLYIVATADSLYYEESVFDSVSAVMHLRDRTLIIDTVSCFLHQLSFAGSASLPLGEESTGDSLFFDIKVEGDLLKTLEHYKASAVGGSSVFKGEFAGTIASGELSVKKGRFRLHNGEMSVYPNLWEPMDSVTLICDIYKADSMRIDMVGKVKRRRLRLRNSYTSSDSLLSFTYGLLDMGTFIVETPDGAIPIFIPGFQENRKGNTTLVEVAGKEGVPQFTLSGPFDAFKVSGTLLLRKSEFTFPMLDDVQYEDPFDPFPYITFDLDIRPADRSVTYFYQLGDSKKRRGLRMIEADLDPSQTIALRGRDLDKTFKILGGLRAFRGYLFYGSVFDKNFEMGLDFRPELMDDGGYDNLPIVWGSADNIVVSSSGDQKRSSVKVMVKDSVTGELHEHVRFGELVILPASEGLDAMSYDEKSARFYTETSRSITDPGRAGEMVSSIGDDYFNTVWLNFWGRRLARKIGFDVLRFETSLLSNSFNYFQERAISPEYNTSFGIWALENSGITMGKYVFGDNLLLKAQTSLIVLDTSLTPSYNLGFEYQPFRYLWMDFHYGMHQSNLTDELQFDPTFQLQMRVPLEDFKKVFKKRE